MLKVCSVFPSGKGHTLEGDLKQTSLTTKSRWGQALVSSAWSMASARIRLSDPLSDHPSDHPLGSAGIPGCHQASLSSSGL